MNETGDAPERANLNSIRVREFGRVAYLISARASNLHRGIPNAMQLMKAARVHWVPALMRTVPNLDGDMSFSGSITGLVFHRIIEPKKGQVDGVNIIIILLVFLFHLIFRILCRLGIFEIHEGLTNKLHICGIEVLRQLMCPFDIHVALVAIDGMDARNQAHRKTGAINKKAPGLDIGVEAPAALTTVAGVFDPKLGDGLMVNTQPTLVNSAPNKNAITVTAPVGIIMAVGCLGMEIPIAMDLLLNRNPLCDLTGGETHVTTIFMGKIIFRHL